MLAELLGELPGLKELLSGSGRPGEAARAPVVDRGGPSRAEVEGDGRRTGPTVGSLAGKQG